MIYVLTLTIELKCEQNIFFSYIKGSMPKGMSMKAYMAWVRSHKGTSKRKPKKGGNIFKKIGSKISSAYNWLKENKPVSKLAEAFP